LPLLSTLHFALVDVAITLTFLPLTALHFALADVASALIFLHGVVFVVWLCLSTIITMPSFQGSDCLILFWLSIGE
jgi:hypothetical protein